MSEKLYGRIKYTLFLIIVICMAYFVFYYDLKKDENIIVFAGFTGGFYRDAAFTAVSLAFAGIIAAGSVYKFGKKLPVSLLLAEFLLLLTAFAFFPKDISSYKEFVVIHSPDGKHIVLVRPEEPRSGLFGFGTSETEYYQPIGRFLYHKSYSAIEEMPVIKWDDEGFYGSEKSDRYIGNFARYTPYNEEVRK